MPVRNIFRNIKRSLFMATGIASATSGAGAWICDAVARLLTQSDVVRNMMH